MVSKDYYNPKELKYFNKKMNKLKLLNKQLGFKKVP